MGIYVFGIEGVPLFETLFIILLLMLIGLILILYEVRKLRRLIVEERIGIRRFEADLSEFERESKKPKSLW